MFFGPFSSALNCLPVSATDAAPTITDSQKEGSSTLAPSEREPGFPQSGRPLEASSWKHQILICHLQSSDWCCAAAMVDLLDHWSSASVIAEFLVASRVTSLTAVSPGSSTEFSVEASGLLGTFSPVSELASGGETAQCSREMKSCATNGCHGKGLHERFHIYNII